MIKEKSKKLSTIKTLEEKIRILDSKAGARKETKTEEQRFRRNKRKRDDRKLGTVIRERDDELLQKNKLHEILNGDGCIWMHITGFKGRPTSISAREVEL